MRKIAITGHRPKGVEKHGWAIEDFYPILERVLVGLKPDLIISGMALGADQLAADIALRNQIPYLAAIPFVGQEAKWTEYQKYHYFELLKNAAKMEVLADAPTGYYDAVKLLHTRNEWMVDHASAIVALWDGSKKGGTAHCVRYAKRAQLKRQLPIIQINAASKAVSRLSAHTPI